MAKQNKEEIDNPIEENNKLLKGILLTLLENKPRENKAKILKEAGFNQPEIITLCGPSEITLRTRKYRENKKKK